MWRGMLVFLLLRSGCFSPLSAQDSLLWHGMERQIRYMPTDEGFHIHNGTRRFNRALYGGHTAFRVEAGDLPQFALYLPGMGGSMQLGLSGASGSKWLIDAENIDAWYESGQMYYAISDEWLEGGTLYVYVMALPSSDGIILKIRTKNIPAGLSLVWAFGGATGKRFNRDGDIGADPESVFYLLPEHCRDNHYVVEQHTFSLLFGSGKPRIAAEGYGRHWPRDSISGILADGEKILQGIVPPSMQLKISDAGALQHPSGVWNAEVLQAPVLVGILPLASADTHYFCVQVPNTGRSLPRYEELPVWFESARSVVTASRSNSGAYTR
ncbi:MAG: DUF4450 domain-containing protein [Haliscomenobacter sp.]